MASYLRCVSMIHHVILSFLSCNTVLINIYVGTLSKPTLLFLQAIFHHFLYHAI